MEPSSSSTIAVVGGDLLSFSDLERMHGNDVNLDDDGVDEGERNPDYDDNNLSSMSLADVPELDIFGQVADRPSGEEALEAINQDDQNEVDSSSHRPDLPPLVIRQETVNNDEENGSPPIPNSRSNAHHYIDSGKAVFLSLDDIFLAIVPLTFFSYVAKQTDKYCYKEARQDLDIPFLKLSNGARLGIARGWFREAVIKLKTTTGKVYYIQCTTWRDKKQVCFLSSNGVGSSNGLTVRRHKKGRDVRDVFAGPKAQKDYVEHFNAVDRNDRDSANYSTTIRTIRYYIRIFCWVLDRVVHATYVTVCYLVWVNVDWARYLSKNNGRHDFQINLGIELMNVGIAMSWDGVGERPNWMRQGDWVPCECKDKNCYFCMNGHTTGIAHKRKRDVVVDYKCGTRVTNDECTEDRVSLDQGCNYCKMCYRRQDNSLSYAEKRKKCKTSTKGCKQCQEVICKYCWDEGYDKHKK